MSSDSLELEQGRGEFKPRVDHRRTLPEPPPVRLTAVEDVHAPSAAGMEVALDEFYGGVLRFERDLGARETIVYKAENFRLIFDVLEPPVAHGDFRPILVEVPVLAEVEMQLIEREIEYERQRGLSPGRDQLVLLDPAGNWVSIGEMREFR